MSAATEGGLVRGFEIRGRCLGLVLSTEWVSSCVGIGILLPPLAPSTDCGVNDPYGAPVRWLEHVIGIPDYSSASIPASTASGVENSTSNGCQNTYVPVSISTPSPSPSPSPSASPSPGPVYTGSPHFFLPRDPGRSCTVLAPYYLRTSSVLVSY